MRNASTWCARIGGAVLLLGIACGAGAGAQAAGLGHAAPGARHASAAIQPVYWTHDRYVRRVWVERHYRRPPPPHHRHHGWVDRYGRWHRS